MRTPAVLLCLLLGTGPASALIDCRSATLATRLLAAQTDLAGRTSDPGPALDALERAVAARSGPVRLVGEGGAIGTTDKEAVEALVRISRRILWSDRSPRTLNEILNASTTRTVRRHSNLAVLRAACATPAGTVIRNDSALELSAGKVDGQPDALSGTGTLERRKPVTGMLSAGTVVIVLSSIVLARQIYRMARLRRRRSVRHNVSHDIIFRRNDVVHAGRILDINCFGLKLQHFGRVTGSDHVEVEILGEWRAIRVKWQNAHYAGATFTERLSLSSVLLIVASSGHRGTSRPAAPSPV